MHWNREIWYRSKTSWTFLRCCCDCPAREMRKLRKIPTSFRVKVIEVGCSFLLTSKQSFHFPALQVVDQVLQENLVQSYSSASNSTEELLHPVPPASLPPTAAKVLEAALPVSTKLYPTPAPQPLQTCPLRHSTPHKGMQLPDTRLSTCNCILWNDWLQVSGLVWLVQLKMSVLHMLVHKCVWVCVAQRLWVHYNVSIATRCPTSQQLVPHLFLAFYVP